MISLTYRVSRYRDSTALSVFVSLHMSHPAPRWPLMWDKRLSSCRGGGVPRAIVYDEIDEYIDGLANRGDPALRAVEQQGEKEGWPIVAAAEGSFLHILARSIRARRILELGTAIGYSGTWL